MAAPGLSNTSTAVPAASLPLRVLGSAAEAASWLHEQGALALRADSRALGEGEAFIAWPGYAHDGRQYVAAALQAGAAAVLVEAEGAERFAPAWRGDARVAALRGLKGATGEVASRFHGQPSEQLAVLAVTGTNGKTSSAWWLAQASALLGQPARLVGTLGLGELQALHATGLTTPDPVTLQAALARFVREGAQVLAIEASSIGLEEGRLNGCRIATALFTNLSQDHLDYHGSMAAYWAAKRRLFDWPGLGAAVVNIDDAHGAALAEELRGRPGLALWTVASQQGGARLFAADAQAVAEGWCFSLCERVGETVQRVATSAPAYGAYNLSNLLGVVAALRAQGHALEAIAAALPKLRAVPGRLQPVPAPDTAAGALPQVLVDYAHTPDALEKVLATLAPLAQQRGGALWVVFGCGGNRDAGKRPLMGALAVKLAQQVIVTSDNPRNEDAAAIVQQVMQGASQAQAARAAGAAAEGLQAIVDRHAAIGAAIAQAAAKDIVLLAGKGHETTQEIAGVKHPFDDCQVAYEALLARAAASAVEASPC
jgi:UDP-N-acetylmuramyl-tripeptide synthetase